MRAEDILKKRRDRAIAIILNVKERDVDQLLPRSPAGDRASKAMRKVVLDQINDLCDMACDIVTSSEVATFEFNPEIWEAKINDIHRAVTGKAS
jgi:hypothetical protein